MNAPPLALDNFIYKLMKDITEGRLMGPDKTEGGMPGEGEGVMYVVYSIYIIHIPHHRNINRREGSQQRMF